MFKNLITESMSKSPWLFHINAGSCNGCDIELVAVLTPRYDAERLGFKLTGTPRHADVVVVTGPVTKQVLPRVLRAISQVPEPRVIVTMGSCPQSGNVFRGSYSVAGPLSKYVDVDVDIAPKPEAIIDGLALAMKILSEKRAAMNGKVEAKAAPAEEPKEVHAEPAAEAVQDAAPAAPVAEEVAAAQEGGEQ